MEKKLCIFCCTVIENALCFYKTRFKEKSLYGKDALLEIDSMRSRAEVL